MNQLPPNVNKVKPEHTCDVCRKEKAKYYDSTWFIHICSMKCREIFIVNYNKEIEQSVIIKLKPDKSDAV